MARIAWAVQTLSTKMRKAKLNRVIDDLPLVAGDTYDTYNVYDIGEGKLKYYVRDSNGETHMFKDRVFNDYFTIVYEGDKQNL